MAGSTTDEAKAFNKRIIEEFRANEGRVSGFSARTPIILIHHIGARSGIESLTPLGCFPLGDDRYVVIVASSGGSPTHSDWYHNLKAHPRIDVEVGTRAFTVLAEELDDRARAEL